jgi:hypothetical protein
MSCPQFHSPALDLNKLTRAWCALVFRLGPGILRVNLKPVLVGDGIKVAKAGRKMPGVKKLHQESDSNTKPEYIFGHSCQAVASPNSVSSLISIANPGVAGVLVCFVVRAICLSPCRTIYHSEADRDQAESCGVIAAQNRVVLGAVKPARWHAQQAGSFRRRWVAVACPLGFQPLTWVNFEFCRLDGARRTLSVKALSWYFDSVWKRFWKLLGDLFRIKTIGDILGWWSTETWHRWVSGGVAIMLTWISQQLHAPMYMLPLILLVAFAVAVWLFSKLPTFPHRVVSEPPDVPQTHRQASRDYSPIVGRDLKIGAGASPNFGSQITYAQAVKHDVYRVSLESVNSDGSAFQLSNYGADVFKVEVTPLDCRDAIVRWDAVESIGAGLSARVRFSITSSKDKTVAHAHGSVALALKEIIQAGERIVVPAKIVCRGWDRKMWESAGVIIYDDATQALSVQGFEEMQTDSGVTLLAVPALQSG